MAMLIPHGHLRQHKCVWQKFQQLSAWAKEWTMVNPFCPTLNHDDAFIVWTIENHPKCYDSHLLYHQWMLSLQLASPKESTIIQNIQNVLTGIASEREREVKMAKLDEKWFSRWRICVLPSLFKTDPFQCVNRSTCNIQNEPGEHGIEMLLRLIYLPQT